MRASRLTRSGSGEWVARARGRAPRTDGAQPQRAGQIPHRGVHISRLSILSRTALLVREDRHAPPFGRFPGGRFVS